VALYGAMITAVTLAAFVWQLDGPIRQAQTVAFMTLAFAQLFHLGNARSEEPLAGWKHLSNPYALGAVVLSIALQLLAIYVQPLARVLGVEPLDARSWFLVLSLAVIPAVLGQGIKLVRRRKRTRANRR
jgi:Ca2+-transporting ATPase